MNRDMEMADLFELGSPEDSRMGGQSMADVLVTVIISAGIAVRDFLRIMSAVIGTGFTRIHRCWTSQILEVLLPNLVALVAMHQFRLARVCN